MSYQLPVSRLRGYTLMELMMVVVIVAILAAIALPSYQEYVIRANRSAVQQFMMDASTRLEQYRLDMIGYPDAVVKEAIQDSDINLPLPSEVVGNYDVFITVTDATTAVAGYTILAEPKGRQASDGDLTLNSLGEKTPSDKW